MGLCTGWPCTYTEPWFDYQMEMFLQNNVLFENDKLVRSTLRMLHRLKWNTIGTINCDKIFVASLTHKLFARSIVREDRKNNHKILICCKIFWNSFTGSSQTIIWCTPEHAITVARNTYIEWREQISKETVELPHYERITG